ncbi:putative tetratricopeptide-like helical domain superfamily [Dioscorea sansibarensis]
MILGWKRSLQRSLIRTLKTFISQSCERPQSNLSPQLVNLAISKCPSDLISLSFFLWAARQPSYFHDPSSFDLMVPIVHRLTDRFGSVSGIVDELESIGCSRKAQALLVLMRVFWRGDLYSLALEAFDEMGSRSFVPNTFARNIVVDILFKTGHFDAALRFFKDTTFPNFISFNIIIGNLCKYGDWRSVGVLLREMIDRGFWPNSGTYAMVLDCFHKAGRIMELLQLLGFMTVLGEQFSVAIWTILIDLYRKIGSIDMAGKLFGKMLESGCSPHVVTYTTLIKGFLESNMDDELFGLLDVMISNGCEPDLVLYNILINSLCKIGRYDDAISVFCDLHWRNLRPDSYTLSSLISALCLSGRLSLFPKLIVGSHVSVDLVLFNSLLCFLCKAGFPSRAVKFYIDMVSGGIVPDKYSYVGLLNALCSSGKTEIAINFYGEIVSKNKNVDSYIHTVILDGLIKRGKLPKAIKIFRRGILENYHLDVVSYTVAIHGLFQDGRFEEAHNLFDQMKQFGIVPNMHTYNVMISGMCKVKDVRAVIQLLGEMKMVGLEMDCISFNKIIGLLIKMRRVHSAFRVYMAMCHSGVKPNRATYSLLLKGLSYVFDGQVGDLQNDFKANIFTCPTDNGTAGKIVLWPYTIS